MLTTAPIEAAETSKPEWIRVSQMPTLFGISRSITYELMATKEIKSTLIRKRGVKKGIRLINADSVREFLSKNEEQEG